MTIQKSARAVLILAALTILAALPVPRAQACGGFFCQFVPINQAGEQIIFRQDGDMVTAVVLIQYVGNAEDFSWVVPVPGIPTLATGSEAVFGALELATRPQFNLTINGAPCLSFDNDNVFQGAPSLGGSGDPEDDGVDVLQKLAVGPYDIQIVRSTSAGALATWLADNDYDLSDRGRELIEPYVLDDMNFVAVRLQQDRGVGDLQPLIMKYESADPMVPIQLTAVAAQPDMGVLVWLLGEARAVPLNYLHVTPNYTLLNWYSGTFNAYASYQGLITTAMNEAGGQGFATDYAGRDIDLSGQLPSLESYGDELRRINGGADDAETVVNFANSFVFPQDQVFEILRRTLPLPGGIDEFVYYNAPILREIYETQELTAARVAIITAINTELIDPLNATLAVFDGDPYLTRLYTTLSAEEMTLDPTFSFNPDLGDQPIAREAELNVNCNLGTTRWTLTLGKGTDREGELVIDGTGDVPGLFAAPPVLDQLSVFRSEEVGRTGAPLVKTQNTFRTAVVQNGTQSPLFPPINLNGLCGSGSACGAGSAAAMVFLLIGLTRLRR